MRIGSPTPPAGMIAQAGKASAELPDGSVPPAAARQVAEQLKHDLRTRAPLFFSRYLRTPPSDTIMDMEEHHTGVETKYQYRYSNNSHENAFDLNE